jgi:hypothetical protein
MFRIKKSIHFIFLCAFIFGCSREFALSDFNLGSNLSSKGLITDTKTEFSFSYSGGGAYTDLFNYIYFQGDTVCFSYDFNGDVAKNARVWFVDQASGRKKDAERIEVLKSRVYGFALAGSLLEFFKKDSLHNKIGTERKIVQPFTLIIEAEGKGKKIVAEKKGEFTVTF